MPSNVTVFHQPTAPIAQQGDIWVNQTTGELRIHNGTNFAAVSISQPSDDQDFALGADDDVVLELRSTALAADAEVTGLIVGTSDHQGVAANSLILSNITQNGDILILVNNGGNSVEAMLVDASANQIVLGHGGLDTVIANGVGLIVGNTAQVTFGPNAPEVQVLGTAGADSTLGLGRWSADVSGPVVRFLKSRNAAIGSQTIVQNGDTLGDIIWYADDGGDNATPAALIRVEVDGAPGADDMPARMIFYTTPDGTNAVVNRLQINADGSIAVTDGAPKVTLGTVSAFGTTQPTNTLVMRAGTAPAGAITTAGGLFSSTTVVRKIIADGTVSNVET